MRPLFKRDRRRDTGQGTTEGRGGPEVARQQKLLTCPQCGGHDLYYENALITGYKYHCKDCDYIGPFIIEQDVDLDREGRVVDHERDRTKE